MLVYDLVIYNVFYQLKPNMIDLQMMPPDWNFAENHAKANKPGLVNNLNANSTNVFCPCCLKPIIKKQVPLLNNSKQLQFMGFGFPLYFIFIKYCIILLLILICSYSTIQLYWSMHQNDQSCAHRLLSASGNTHCSSFFVKKSRIVKIVPVQQEIVRVTSFIIHLFALIYMRDNIMKTMEYYNQRTTSLSDYSLTISNLPLKEGIQQCIKSFIDNHLQQKWNQLNQLQSPNEIKNIQKIAQITLLPQINDYYTILNKKTQTIQKKRKLYIQKEYLPNNLKNYQQTQLKSRKLQEQIRNVNEELNLINKNIIELSTSYRILAKQDKLCSEVAIVTFNQSIYVSTLLQYSQHNKLDSNLLRQHFGQFQGQIHLQKAPQPNEIIWRNVNSSKKTVITSIIFGWLLTIIFIAIITIGFYWLLLLKTNYLLSAIEQSSNEVDAHSSIKYKFAIFLVFFDIILIVLFNKLVMGAVLHYITHFEKHFKTSSQQFSFALKYTIGLFFTTALMTLAVQALTFHNFYSHQYGVIQQQSIMFIINAILIPLIWLVNPWQIFNLILRRFRKNKKFYTQRQANTIMCDTPYTMGKRYAQIVETMWFTFLYASLIPGGAFCTIIGLCLYYWVDKFNLLKRSSLMYNVSGQMAVVSLKLLDLTLIFKPVGQLIFDYSIRDGKHITSIVLVVIAGLYLLLPINSILSYLHPQQFKPQQKSFDQVKDTFLQTYQTLHPILSFKAAKTFQNLKKKISKQISLNYIEISDIHLDNKYLNDISKRQIKIGQQNGNNGRNDTLENINQNYRKYQVDDNMNIYKSSKTQHINYVQDMKLKNLNDQQTNQQFLNYQYRSKKAKNASKSYFSQKKNFQHLNP